jgi:CSLREA domain-containing protein
MRAHVRSIFNRFSVLAALTALITSAAYVTPAYAAGIVVNTAGDTVNANDGRCSLREAITAANTNTASGPAAGECAAGSEAGGDDISFPGDYTIITLSPGLGQLPAVTGPIAIHGWGANTVIQANANPDTATTRVFYVESGGNLALTGLTILNGRCNGSCASIPNSGGAVYNAGTLAVIHTVIRGSSASSMGGGIYNTGTLRVTGSIISGNSANAGGGGLASSAMLTVTNSHFEYNSSPALAGGIYNSGALTVAGSIFLDNSASSGGGIVHTGNSTLATIENSSFSDNSAGSFGSGIYSAGQSILTVRNSTFASNSASSGSGIHKVTGAGTATLQNTIVANSTTGINCSGTIINGGNNLDSGATCGWGSDNGSLSNTDPKLGGLVGGGSTLTMSLLASSPAIDAGADAGCPATDQRGVRRPQGAHCDIGAYEAPLVMIFRSGGAQDGWVLESGENSNQGGAVHATAATFLLGDNGGNRQYLSILHFNTSALPDNAVIAGVRLRIRKQSVSGTDPFTTHQKMVVDVRKGAFSNNPALQAADFQAVASQAVAGVFVSSPTATGWYAVRLKLTAYPFINLTGSTQFRLRFKTDDDNDAVADIIKFYSGDAPAANRPVLVIEYYVP